MKDRESLVQKSSREDKLERKKRLICPRCPPNRGENSKRVPRRGYKKPKHKDKIK